MDEKKKREIVLKMLITGDANFNTIAKSFRDTDMVKAYIDIKRTLKGIPTDLLTGPIIQYFASQFGSQKLWANLPDNFSVYNLPEELKNFDMVQSYVDAKKTLKGIPDDLLTNQVIKYYAMNFSDSLHFLEGLPESFITPNTLKTFIDKHIDKKTLFTYIPESFITTDIVTYACTRSGYQPQDYQEYMLTYHADTRPFEEASQRLNIQPGQYKYNQLFNKTGKLTMIPREFITREMAESYAHKTGDFSSIPEGMLSDEFLINYLLNNPNPPMGLAFHLTQKVADMYFQSTYDLKSLPADFVTQVMADAYFEKTGDLNAIPVQRVTQEMADTYFEKTSDLASIPRGYITQAMAESYYEKTGDFMSIPQNCITQNIANKYFEKTGDLSAIPVQCITPKMAQTYFNQKQSLIHIPKKLITQKMADIYFAKTGDISALPSRCITPDMANRYFEKTGDLSSVPRHCITQAMADAYFAETGSLHIIPAEMLTQDMEQDIPNEFRADLQYFEDVYGDDSYSNPPTIKGRSL